MSVFFSELKKSVHEKDLLLFIKLTDAVQLDPWKKIDGTWKVLEKFLFFPYLEWESCPWMLLNYFIRINLFTIF